MREIRQLPAPSAGAATPPPPGPAATPGAARAANADTLVDIDDRRPRRIGWLLLVVGFGGFLAWSLFAKLDAGVPVPGTVIVAGQRQAVQPQAAGKVAAILAQDGDTVAKGDTVLRLDATEARAQYEIAQVQWFGALAVQARLEAELAGRDHIEFPPQLLTPEAASVAGAAMAVQEELFAGRKRALESEITVLREIGTGHREQLQSLGTAAQERHRQLVLLRDQLANQRALADEGFLARNRVSEQERNFSALAGADAEEAGARARSAQALAETQARMVATRQAYLKESETQLGTVQPEAMELASRVHALKFQLDASEVRAPAAGVVMGSTVHTVGGMVPAGQTVMEIVPTGAALQVEARIPRQLIDKVHAGLPVHLNFPAFARATTPSVPGRVVRVSADALVDPVEKVAYYQALVEVTPEGVAALGKHGIKAGMPAEVFIITGERTPMNYLLKPLHDRTRRALAEP